MKIETKNENWKIENLKNWKIEKLKFEEFKASRAASQASYGSQPKQPKPRCHPVRPCGPSTIMAELKHSWTWRRPSYSPAANWARLKLFNFSIFDFKFQASLTEKLKIEELKLSSLQFFKSSILQFFNLSIFNYSIF